MERLTKRISESLIELSAKANPIQYNGKPQRVHIKHPFWNVFDRLAAYEDAEEQGLLIRLPCKVGTPYWTFEKQYWIDEEKCRGCKNYYNLHTETFCDCEEDYPKCTQIVEKYFYNNLEIVSLMRHIGKTVFLTKEEAEQALKQMEGGK